MIERRKLVIKYLGTSHDKETASLQGSGTGHYCLESLPTLHEIGRTYTTVPINALGANSGYTVRVLAVSNDTQVDIPELALSLTLDAGDYHQVDDHPGSRIATRVSCNKR